MASLASIFKGLINYMALLAITSAVPIQMQIKGVFSNITVPNPIGDVPEDLVKSLDKLKELYTAVSTYLHAHATKLRYPHTIVCTHACMQDAQSDQEAKPADIREVKIIINQFYKFLQVRMPAHWHPAGARFAIDFSVGV
jgi:hypothetical protein